MKSFSRKFLMLTVSVILLLVTGCGSQAQQANANSKLQVIAKAQANSRNTVDLFIRDETTAREEYFKTITDGYLNHYHSSESHNSNYYLIRRIGYDGSADDDDWSDELWRYTPQKKAAKRYSIKGLDFRVASNEKTIALTGGEVNSKIGEQFIFLNDSGKEIKRYNVQDLLTGQENKAYIPMIGLLKWSDNSENLWGVLAEGSWIETMFSINISTWEIKKYSTEDLPLDFEFELNANRGLLLFSDYPLLLDICAEREFNSSQKSINLYVYDLETRRQQTISTSITKRFNPKWLDDDTIEFDSPAGNGRQISKID